VDSPIRVLHVVVNMNRGGAETLIMNLYRNIDRSLVQFDFLTNKHGIFDTEIESMGGKVHRIPYITEGGPFKYNNALETFFKNHPEYKIVHSHMDKMSGFVLRTAKKFGVPIRIAHSHNTGSEGNIIVKGIKWFAGQFLLKNATHYFACSNSAAKWLFRAKSYQTNILKNGIDLTVFKPLPGTKQRIREQYNLSKDYFIVGHVGRLCHQKNHEFLLDVFSKIHDINPDSVLMLVGDGPLMNKIKSKVESAGLTNNVLFLGIQSNIHEIIQAFDIMVFPSKHEGLPVTLIEAQSIGIPCLVSNCITNEVDIGANLIRFESLKTSPMTWAIKALTHVKTNEVTSSYIDKHGYNIEQSALWIENFYMTTIFKEFNKSA
jgi:glycosyltransferase involved in cell wall biosynthesis